MQPRTITIPKFSEDEIKDLQGKRRALIANPVHLPSLEQAYAQEQQVDASYELAVNLDQDIGVKEEKGIEDRIEIYTDLEFLNALRAQKVKLPKKVYDALTPKDSLFRGHLAPIEKIEGEVIKWWRKLLGNIEEDFKPKGYRPNPDCYYDKPPHPDLKNPRISKISRPAIEMILKNFDDFTCMGIDLDNILEMDGFYLKNKVLHYDPLRKSSQRRTHIAVILKKDDKELVESKENKEYVEKRDNHPHASAWWDYLYAAHKKNHCNGTKAELSAMFNNFLNYLDQYKLCLPPLPSKEQGEPFLFSAKSLPVTLGRIITLIDNCEFDQDRQVQLNFTPYLDLGSQGAIRALDKRLKTEGYRCRFVHPLMNCTATDFDYQYGYMADVDEHIAHYKLQFSTRRVCEIFLAHRTEPENIYVDTDKPAGIWDEKSSLASTEKTFWRYIAHHKGMPLAFYQDAVMQIKKIKKLEAQAYAYWCLAELSTGHMLDQVHDQEKMANQWNNLCNMVKSYESSIPLMDLSLSIMVSLHNLPQLPPLDLLDKIVTLADSSSSPWHKQKIVKSFDRLDNVLEFLKDCGIPPRDLYFGMRFCVKEQNEHKEDPFLGEASLFYKYLDRFELIQKIGTTRIPRPNKIAIQFLIQSGDTFDLTTVDSINTFLENIDYSSISSQFMQFCLIEILGNIQNRKKDGQLLTLEGDLVPILKKMAGKFQDEFIQYMKNKYASCFEKGFLEEQLEAVATNYLDPKIKSAIREKFQNNEQAAEILIKIMGLRHAKKGSKELNAEPLEKTLKLLQEFASFYEHDPSMMTDLLQQILIYDQAHEKVQYSLAEFNHLLEVILRDGNPCVFEALLYRPDFEKIPGFFQKITEIYCVIVPWLEKNHERISRNQTYPAAVDVFLAASSSEELKDNQIPEKYHISSDAGEKEQKRILELNTLLKDTQSLKEITDEQKEQYYSIICDLMDGPCGQQYWSMPLIGAGCFLEQWRGKKIEDQKEEKTTITASVLEKKEPVQQSKQPSKGLFGWIGVQAKTVVNSVAHLLLPEEKEKKGAPSSAPKTERLTAQSTQALLEAKYKNSSFAEIQYALSTFVADYKRHKQGYSLFLINYYENIYEIIKKHPRTKKDLLAYMSYFVPHQSLNNQHIAALKDQIDCLQQLSGQLTESELCRILYYAREEKNPLLLIHNIQAIKKYVPEDLQQLFYQFLARLSGEKALKSDNSELFINLCKLGQSDPALCKTVLRYCYQSPPYQRLETVCEWLEDKAADSKMIEEKYDAFSREPVKRLADNNFDEVKALAQAKRFSRHDHLTLEVIHELKEYTDFYRNKTTQEKIDALEDLKRNPPISTIHLTVLLSELLYSTANQPFNYTQLLALYSALSGKGMEVYQIATGQGKSRISMAIIAGKTILGRKVNFLTSSMKLAERDFYNTRAFFSVCGIPTKLITVNTPISDYAEEKESFIGFSSYDELGLFYNKLEVEQALIQPREFFFDEADIVYTDPGILHFNYAQQKIGNAFKKIEWIYPLLVRFVYELNFKDHYQDETFYHVYDSFTQFLNKNKISHAQWDQLDAITQAEPRQLETWMRAAIIATRLKNKVHFDLEKAKNVLQMTPLGLRVVSKAVPIVNNLAAEYANFSNAVHQCLHARLNIERQQKRDMQQPDMKSERSTPLYIETESNIVFTSTADTLLKRCSGFSGVTGSYGSPIVRNIEMEKRYPGTRFIRAPGHQVSRRIDLPAHIVANEEQQIATLQRYHDAVIEKQPVLIFATDDIKSDTFQKKMKSPKSQNIGANLKEYEKKISFAEQPGVATFSTSVIGRGVDIRPNPELVPEGLHELRTFIPESSDEIQIDGRVGRLGDKGQIRPVLSLEDIEQELGITDHKPLEQDERLVGLFVNREHFIKDLQMKKDKATQDQRTIALLIQSFAYQIESDFSKKKNKDILVHYTAWIQFKNELDEKINTLFDLIKKEQSLEVSKLIKQLESFFTQSQEDYNKLLIQCGLPPLTSQLVEADWREKLRHQLRPLNLELPRWQKTQEHYDPANDGQHVIYTSLFAETRGAWKRWRTGEDDFTEIFWNTKHRTASEEKRGLRHPEWQAFKRGQRGLFANTR